jgi:peptidoglycan hydrolase-like protein with peptidoglycan-binding domain
MMASRDDHPTLLATLKTGDHGERVFLWQSFLRGAGFDPGPLDSDFGKLTFDATVAYQLRNMLDGDGEVGQQTLLRAAAQGLAIADRSGTGENSSDFPPRPTFPPLVSNEERAAVFGYFDFEPAPTPDDKEHVRILGGWQRENMVKVPVPQIKGVTGSRGRDYIWFHRLGAAQLQRLWQAWEDEGLLDLVLTWQGSFNPRFVRGSTTDLSNHAFGSGFDINYAWNRLGHIPALADQKGSVRRLVPIANRHGFYWGGHYQRRPDGMHFEIATLLG